MYMESLNNYLPDDLNEDDPTYREYIKKLPQKKAELEKKYPQVCKKCAPKAQERIHKADYYGMSQHAGLTIRRTSARRGQSPIGQRDDWSKWSIRFLLGLVGMIAYASLLVQAAWHAYGAFMTVFTLAARDDIGGTPFVFEPTLRECTKQSMLLRFDTLCYDLLSSLVPKALLVRFLLLWYNPGLKAWYHNTYRMEAVHGQTEHFRTQLILLIVRTIAWSKLSNPALTDDLSAQQLLAAHGFMIALMLTGQWISERPIKSDRWRMKGKIMPKPDEKDVFGATAGPRDENYSRQASSVPPFRLFARDDKPFPIENLAPKPRNTRGYSKLDLPSMPPPSPPDTQSDSEDDAMDMDWQPSRTAGMPGAPIDRTFRPKNYGSHRPQTRSIYNYGTTQPSGWSAMRNEVFGMQDQIRAEEERKRKEAEERAKLRYQPPVEPSPFRGRLVQAPMSMGRRLRNPPTQVQFKQTPLSKQQDFMKQMRDSFEHGKTFGRKDVQDNKAKTPSRRPYDEDDEDFSPAKSRTRGGLDLRPGTWHLPGDGMQMTGLEDAFGGKGFGVADESVVEDAPLPAPSKGFPWVWAFVVAAPIVVIAVGWNIMAIRRPFCLWLVQKMDEMGL